MGHPHLGFSFHKAGVGVGGKWSKTWLAFLIKGVNGGRGPPRWGSEAESSSIVTERQTRPLGLITVTMPGRHGLKACVLLSMPSSQIRAPGLHLWSWHLPKKPCADGYLHVKTRAIVRVREQELLCSIISLSWDVGGGFWSLGKLACSLPVWIWVHVWATSPVFRDVALMRRYVGVDHSQRAPPCCSRCEAHRVPSMDLDPQVPLLLQPSPKAQRRERVEFEELQTNEFAWALGLHGFVGESCRIISPERNWDSKGEVKSVTE